jgi:NAD(P)-dependent dehydrogenase (short-subunit alcohol dehydrogenase family)
LSRRTVLVTGASRGVGRAVAEASLRRGDMVVASARRSSDLARLAGLGELVPLVLDLGDEAAIMELGPRLSGRMGHLDTIFNCAGVYSLQSKWWDSRTTPLATVTDEELVHVYRINAVAPMLLTRVLRPLLAAAPGGGRVVNLTSLLGSVSEKDTPGDYAYCASKAALNIMTRGLAAELAGDGIICVAVTPGWVRTDMGGAGASLTPEESAAGLLATTDRLTRADSGRLIDERGDDLPW